MHYICPKAEYGVCSCPGHRDGDRPGQMMTNVTPAFLPAAEPKLTFQFDPRRNGSWPCLQWFA